MPVMEKLKMFVIQEPVVTASGFGLFLPAVVRPILDSLESSKQVQPAALTDVDVDMFDSISSIPLTLSVSSACPIS